MMVWIIISAIALIVAFSLWCCIRINHPETEEEERAQIESDYAEFMEQLRENAIKPN